MSKTLAIKGGSKLIINQLFGRKDFDEKTIRVVEAISKTLTINSRAYSKGMQLEEKLTTCIEKYTFSCFLLPTFLQEDCERIGKAMQKVKAASLKTGIN